VVTGLEAVPAGFALGHLNRRKCTNRACHSSGAHVLTDLEDASVAGRKNDVYWKLHPERVNCRARRDNHRMVGCERGTAEQTSRARCRVEGALYGRSHRAINPASHAESHWACVRPEQRFKERRHGPRS